MRNSFIQQALDEIDIVGLISEDATIERNKARCPFPDHQDTNPSFFIYPPDSFYCFGCKRGGSAIDYIMHRNNMTAGEAIRILCDKYNIPMPQWSDEEKKTWEKQRQEGDIVFKILSAAAEYYHSRLTTQRREYFHQRGLNDETIDKFKLGYADGSLYTAFKKGNKAVHEDWVLNPNLARSYNDAGAIAREAEQSQLLLSGLFVKFEDGTIKDSFERRYMFPYWKSGKVVYFIGRRDTDDPKEIEKLPQWNRAKYKKLSTFDPKERSYISKAVRNDYFYGEDSILEHQIGIITEGVVDCLHLLQAGYSCISPVTEEFKAADFKKLAKLSKRWKTVYIANDNEASGVGEQGAVKTAGYIFEQGLREGVSQASHLDVMKNLTPLLPRALLLEIRQRTNCSSILIFGSEDLHQRNDRICDIWLKLSLQNPKWNYDTIDEMVGEKFNLSGRQIRRIRTSQIINGQDGQTKS